MSTDETEIKDKIKEENLEPAKDEQQEPAPDEQQEPSKPPSTEADGVKAHLRYKYEIDQAGRLSLLSMILVGLTFAFLILIYGLWKYKSPPPVSFAAGERGELIKQLPLN